MPIEPMCDTHVHVAGKAYTSPQFADRTHTAGPALLEILQAPTAGRVA